MSIFNELQASLEEAVDIRQGRKSRLALPVTTSLMSKQFVRICSKSRKLNSQQQWV